MPSRPGSAAPTKSAATKIQTETLPGDRLLAVGSGTSASHRTTPSRWSVQASYTVRYGYIRYRLTGVAQKRPPPELCVFACLGRVYLNGTA